jgi:N-acetylmuramoyl-L-alanine amidase
MKWICGVLAVILVALLVVAVRLEPQSGPAPEGTASLSTQKESTAATQTQPEPTAPESSESATEPAESTVATQPSTQPSEPAQPPTQPPAKVYTVCIDAGHQQRGIPDLEPNGPGSTVMKAKLTSGTTGVATRIEEYKLNLEVSLMLEQELLKRGYKVVMIRRNNDCPLSNAERAEVANNSGADIFVRIHANGSDDPNVTGMLCCAPTKNNPYLTAENIAESIRLSKVMVEKFCGATGAKNRGLYSVDTMTGINWCRVPVTIVEMGYMSSPEEDRKMATQEYREKMVQGMANGIDAYFAAE